MTRTVAFFSYTRFDDRACDGKLTYVRERIEVHLRRLTGEDVHVFQDTDDIKHGKPWQDVLEKGLAESAILIPVLSPRYFNSAACMAELERFRAREADLGRNDLVLSMYWTQARPIERGQGDAAMFLKSRQFADWREHGEPPYDDSQLDAAAYKLAKDICARLEELEEEPHPVPEPAPVAPMLVRSAHEALSVFRDSLRSGGTGPEMVMMPVGAFLMGSRDDEDSRDSDEGPQHRVEIAEPFALAKYPVTFAEYDAFCETTGRKKPDDNRWGRGRRPVIYVSWYDAQDYCAWLSEETGETYRLPSESEWEYACRAGSRTPFEPNVAYTNNGRILIGNEANFSQSHIKRTVQVDFSEYRPNAWGLMQMHGNVWEWCSDTSIDEAYRDTTSTKCGGCWWQTMPYSASNSTRCDDKSLKEHLSGFRVARN